MRTSWASCGALLAFVKRSSTRPPLTEEGACIAKRLPASDVVIASVAGFAGVAAFLLASSLPSSLPQAARPVAANAPSAIAVSLCIGCLLAGASLVDGLHPLTASPSIHLPGERAHPRSMLACMAATPTPESTPQRLAAIRAQMSLLADYL